MRGEWYYLEYGTLRLRWDDMNSWLLTLEEQPQEPGSAEYMGLCGNFDRDPLSMAFFFMCCIYQYCTMN